MGGGTAEQNVLGAMLLDKAVISDVSVLLKAGDFSDPNHRIIYGAIMETYAEGVPVDVVNVVSELDQAKLLKQVGGINYLMELVSVVPTAANAVYYAAIVAQSGG